MQSWATILSSERVATVPGYYHTHILLLSPLLHPNAITILSNPFLKVQNYSRLRTNLWSIPLTHFFQAWRNNCWVENSLDKAYKPVTRPLNCSWLAHITHLSAGISLKSLIEIKTQWMWNICLIYQAWKPKKIKGLMSLTWLLSEKPMLALGITQGSFLALLQHHFFQGTFATLNTVFFLRVDRSKVGAEHHAMLTL